ncbi:natural killer cell receptor 2B4-like isoform X6 [Salminus brasiliensis]|uniref:natural killer cell receptor 2B4-like isoform X6 n=1 Tax=Salminus brasiliensis TaxID=930266 RepID=UPI003B832B6E
MKTLIICGVLLMFTGPALVSGLIAVGSDCISNQPCLFYGALGRPLYLQLPSESQLTLKKNSSGNTSDPILTFKNQTIRQNPPDPRWQFVTENRTMIISRAEKNHSGNYSLDTFDSGGTYRGKYQFQLIIEAEVSSVKITYSCWSSVNRRVSCSSNGDQLSFSWTLNVSPHEHQLTDGNRTLLLDKGSTGTISCSVKNHVSRGSQTIDLQECPDTVLILLGSLTVFLIVISIIACYIYRKKQAQKNTVGSPQDGGELLYVQVNHKPKSGVESTGMTAQAQEESVEYASVVTQPKKKKKKQEDEVQYGEVVFKTPAKQQREQAEGQEECVYSQVQHKR